MRKLRVNGTTLSDREYGERLVASFARAAKESRHPVTSAYYACECVRIARQFLTGATYSTIQEGETGTLIAVSIPYDPSILDTEDDIALARAIHDEIQARIREWFDEEFVRSLYA